MPRDFQSKDFNRTLDIIDIYKVDKKCFNIYATCRKCNNWIELNVTYPVTKKEGMRLIEKRKEVLRRAAEDINRRSKRR